MENSYGTGVGVKNRYDALLFDESMDPLDAIMKSQKPPKNKSKKQGKNKNTDSKLKPEQTKTKEKEPPAKDNKPKEAIDAKSNETINAKPTKPVKKIAMQPLTIEVAYVHQRTLDEYRETRAMNRRKAPKYNLRHPGEGEDLTQWEKLVPLEKKKHDDDKKRDDFGYDPTVFPQRVGRQKHIPVNVTFGDTIVRRGNRQEVTVTRVVASPSPETIRYQRPPKMDNEQEFPFL